MKNFVPQIVCRTELLYFAKLVSIFAYKVYGTTLTNTTRNNFCHHLVLICTSSKCPSRYVCQTSQLQKLIYSGQWGAPPLVLPPRSGLATKTNNNAQSKNSTCGCFVCWWSFHFVLCILESLKKSLSKFIFALTHKGAFLSHNVYAIYRQYAKIFLEQI